MSSKLIEQLYAPVKVDQKPGPGNVKYNYVKTKHILDRLNKVFEGRWSTTVKSYELINNNVLIWLELTVTFDDKEYTQVGFGSAQIFERLDLGSTFKSAKSRAIKDAARSWGLGLDLESGYEEASIPVAPGGPTVNDPPPAMGNPTAVPVANTPTSTNPPAADNGAGFVNSTQPDTQTPFEMPAFSAPPVAEQAPAASSHPVKSPAPPSQNGLPEMASVPNTNGPEALTKITTVQKVAIEGKLRNLGKNFKEYATEVFQKEGKDVNSLPENIDDLSYQDAMLLASYTN